MFQPLTKDRIYFPGLNGIRFIAASMVIVHHIEQIKMELSQPSYWHFEFIRNSGRLGVSLFFVLSGFLITYLLLTEDQRTGTISIRQFYMRRILRIWPLYYFVVVLAFFVLPLFALFSMGETDLYRQPITDVVKILTLFVFFLPNAALILFPAVPYATQAWSVGVEEQFYLVWPLLVKKIKPTEILLVATILACVMLRFGLYFIKGYIFWNNYLDFVLSFVINFRIQMMAIGGLLAFYLFKGDKKVAFLFSPFVQIATYIFLVLILFFKVNISYASAEIIAALFAIIILNVSSNPRSILKLENPILNYLGKISYGLYMYHAICIVVVLKTLNYFNIQSRPFEYCISLALTIVISGISYRYLESYFINKKIRYSKIVSGDNAAGQHPIQ